MARKSLFKRITSNPLVQTFLVYVSGGWIVLEMTDYIVGKYGLSETISNVLPIILLAGLPVALILTWYINREKVEDDHQDVHTKAETKAQGTLKAFTRKLWFSIPISILVVLLVITGIRYIYKQSKTRWANEKALPMIEQYRDEENYPAAFNLLKKADKYIERDPYYIDLADNVGTNLTIVTDPPGATIYARDYRDSIGQWEKWGKTPLDSLWLPSFWFYQVRIEKPGYDPVLAVATTLWDTLFRKLLTVGTIPEGMVYVEGLWREILGDFYGEKNGFFLDRFEVTNKQYKDFVDAGGYHKPEYWTHEFNKEGEVLTFEEAMSEFTDRSGRPGPATWEASDYPDEMDDYPVSGVSWYEAAAYAEYAGKSLPTMWHWASGSAWISAVFRSYFGSFIFPASNFKGEGPVPVGSLDGLGCFGTYDMAGNVKEWCMNETQTGHVILGGAWDDALYMYNNASQLPSFDRSSRNGFRCVLYRDWENLPDSAFQPYNVTPQRDYYSEEPVSDEIFRVYRNQFLYDDSPLESAIEYRDSTHSDWIVEKVTFDAAYGDERGITYLFLPKRGDPPYQTIVYFPGDYAFYEDDLAGSVGTEWFISFLLKDGRAVAHPVYKGHFERSVERERDWGESHQYTDMVVEWTKDFSRTVDYLETRSDIDTSRIGFYGHSTGAENAVVIPAVDHRVKLSIFLAGGFNKTRFLAEVDPVNYVPRIKTPVLMLSGRYDIIYPLETTVMPFYEMLGTPSGDKYLKLFDTDHFVPKSDRIRESLNFLDRYFGPVDPT
jgi:cephalosporin-C deacetylase-like acetyl esterase